MAARDSSMNSSRRSKSVRHGRDEPRGPGPFVFSAGDEVPIAGWAFVDPPELIMPAIELTIVNVQTGATIYLDTQRIVRADVAGHFGDDRLTMSGFASAFRIDDRYRGEHSVRLSVNEESHVYAFVELFSFTVIPLSYELSVRRELAAKFVRGSGLEIGALQRRLELPRHCSVTYVDRMPLSDLLAHYPELTGQPIQEPDLIDDGETLAKVGSSTQDFVIANHFLEHCENPIQTIMNLTRVLKNNGILYMAVPDKRFTFDIDRPATTYSVLAEAFQHGRRRNREELYAEWAAYVIHAAPSEVGAVALQLQTAKYSIHFNVWALPDLFEFLIRCKADFNLPFGLEWLVCSENEVILILRKQSSTSAAQLNPISGAEQPGCSR